MKRQLLFAAIGLAMTGPCVAAEEAATLDNVTGSVMVNDGERFITVRDGHPIQAGERVMMLSGGAANLQFADGCALPLTENTIVTVPEVSTCAGGVADVREYGPQYAQAVGASATDAVVEEEDDDDDKAAGWWSRNGGTVAWVSAGVVAAYLIYEEVEDDDDDEPVSE